MEKAMKKISLFLGMAILKSSPFSLAASPYQASNGWHGILGLGTIFHTQPYQEMGYQILPLPHLIMRQSYFFIDGLKMGYRVAEGDRGYFDLVVTPRLSHLDTKDDGYLQGIEKRNYSVDGGISTQLRQGMMEFNLSAVTDLLDNSNGQELSVSLGNTYILANWMTTLTPALGIKWQSADLVNYYYGVKPNEARANRPIYRGESSFNYYANVNTAALLTKRSTLFAMVEYEYLGEEISASPLLDEGKIVSIFLGYGWQF
jgi:outer membrane protein